MKQLKPTDAHRAYNTALYNRDMIPTIAFGSAGTGKTYGAVGRAVSWLEDKNNKVIVTRPNVSFAEKSGYLPGTEREKLDPWVRPIQQNFDMHGINHNHLECLEKNEAVQFLALETIQGLTFDNTLMIVDECQNMSFQQLKVLLTRIGKYSQLVLCGDIAQVSPKFRGSGLAELIDMIEAYELRVNLIEFTTEDVLRSHQCKQWLEAFENWELGEDK